MAAQIIRFPRPRPFDPSDRFTLVVTHVALGYELQRLVVLRRHGLTLRSLLTLFKRFHAEPRQDISEVHFWKSPRTIDADGREAVHNLHVFRNEYHQLTVEQFEAINRMIGTDYTA
jgi:hypothetical protein